MPFGARSAHPTALLSKRKHSTNPQTDDLLGVVVDDYDDDNEPIRPGQESCHNREQSKIAPTDIVRSIEDEARTSKSTSLLGRLLVRSLCRFLYVRQETNEIKERESDREKKKKKEGPSISLYGSRTKIAKPARTRSNSRLKEGLLLK